MIISIANMAITKMANQLLLSSTGAKKPKIYSTQPTAQNKQDIEYLNASFSRIVDTIHRMIPLSKITVLFISTLAG